MARYDTLHVTSSVEGLRSQSEEEEEQLCAHG